jgi:trimethylamine:corrinoid methyltransferase-like protein
MRKELFIQSQDKTDNLAFYRLNKSRKDMVERAKDRAKKIISSHIPEQVDKQTQKQINGILEKYED